MATVRQLPTRASVPVALRRALALRCPRCGQGRLFAGWFAMHESCAACELRFEREQGYFVGAIYVNYAVTAVICLGGTMALDVVLDLPLWGELAVACSLAAVVPVVFFRYSRSLWLGIDHFVTTTDESMERSSRRPE